MRAAAELLLIEAAALRPILEPLDEGDFDRPTLLPGWSVRDVLGHCGAALTRAATDRLHAFTPEDNQQDVDERKSWPISDVLGELFDGYRRAAEVIDKAGGALDGIGLGEWVHGGDVRDALGLPGAYESEGSELAVDLLFERSRLLLRPPLAVELPTARRHFGRDEAAVGFARCDQATFVRLCGGRTTGVERYDLVDCSPADFVLFS